jgi:isochorismate hydrolase
VYLANYLAPSISENTEFRNLITRTGGTDVLKTWQKPSDMLVFSKIIAPQEGEHLIKKYMYSDFFETHLDSLLRTLNARNLVVVGFDTRICLGTTVTDAMYRNYRVIVLRDCCGTLVSRDGERGLGQLAGHPFHRD